MRKVLTLTLVLLKTAGASFEMNMGRKKGKAGGGKLTSVLLWTVVAISMSSLMLPFYMVFSSLFELFYNGGNLAYAAGLVINIGGVVVFVLAAFSTPALFYFSKDIGALLPMPLTSTQIIGAKFLVALIFEFLGSVFIVLPMAAALWPYAAGAELIFNMVITFVTLPVLPLIYATLVTMFLMRFSGIMKNRDAYNMIVGIIAIVFGVGAGMMSQQFASVSQEALVSFVEGNRAALDVLRSIFPNSIFAGMAAAGDGPQYQLFNLLIVAAALFVFFMLAKVLYFKGVIGISESSAPKKKMTRAEVSRSVSSRSAFSSCLQKEFRMLLRSPVAFMNCVLMVYLMPVIIAGSVFVGGIDTGGNLLEQLNLNVDFTDPQTVSVMFLVSAGLGVFMSAMDMVSVTSITREGPNYFVMKYIPVSYRTQLMAKAASGIIIALPAMLILFLGIAFLLKPPALIFAGMVVISLPGLFLLNNLGLIIDLIRPKLDWENEAHAVKQNVNVMIIMFGGMLLVVPVALLGMFLTSFNLPLLTFAAMFVIISGLAVGSHFILFGKGSKQMAKLGE